MSINRIDFQGAFIRTGDMGAIKAAEDNRPQADQAAFQVQFDKEKEQELKSVQETGDAERQEAKFDAREESKNKYYKQPKKQDGNGKEADADDEDGGVIDMNGRPVGGHIKRSSFDFKV